MKRIIIIFFLISISLIGCSEIDISNMDMIEELHKERITKVKEYNINENERQNQFNHLMANNLSTYIENYGDNIGLYYYNLGNGLRYSINEDKYFNAASTAKVAKAMEILDLIQMGELSLDTVLYYEESDYEAGTGILQNKDTIAPITIKDALELSIKYSDNIANNMFKRITNRDTRDYMMSISGDFDIPEGNYTTSYQQYLLYRRLYENPNNNRDYPMLIEFLKDTEFHDRIDKYINQDIVAHKIGNYYRYYNDCSIVYEDEPYILIILTKDIGTLSNSPLEEGNEDTYYLIDSGVEAMEVIANISRIINEINIESI